MAGLGQTSLARLDHGLHANGSLSVAYELIARARLTHRRPSFGIPCVEVGGRTVTVHETAVCTMPFGTLLRFAKEAQPAQPRVLLISPLFGHFATLLRATVETLLPEHDVYVTDWHNARDVDLAQGRFGLDEYIEHLLRFLQALEQPDLPDRAARDLVERSRLGPASVPPASPPWAATRPRGRRI